MQYRCSLFESTFFSKRSITIDFLDFLQDVKSGKWHKKVHEYRLSNDMQVRDSIKINQLPCITPNGQFKQKSIDGFIEASGLYQIDIDKIPDLSMSRISGILQKDPYVFAFFESISGKGFAAFVKIPKEKLKNNEDSYNIFYSLFEHFYKKYEISIDPTCKDISRGRVASYDPNLYINTDSLVFDNILQIPPPPKRTKSYNKDLFLRDDLEYCIEQIEEKSLNLFDNYHERLPIGLGLADLLGSDGLEYFLRICQFSTSYCDRKFTYQFENFVKHSKETRSVTSSIATFYFKCKEAGLQIRREKTSNKINEIATEIQKGSNLTSFEGDKVLLDYCLKNNIQPQQRRSGDIWAVRQWITDNVSYYVNLINGNLYLDNDKPITDSDFCTFYEKMLSDIYKGKIQFARNTFEAMFMHNGAARKHPLQAAFKENHLKHSDYLSNIGGGEKSSLEPFLELLTASNEHEKEAKFLITKFLVGVLFNLFGESVPNVLVICSEKGGTGKTLIIKNLLPSFAKSYQTEGKAFINHPKDRYKAAASKLLITFDDASEADLANEDIKNLTSLGNFSMREVHGRTESEFTRMASFIFTTNHVQFIDPLQYNRRLIPVWIKESISYEQINGLDFCKIWAEIYEIYEQRYINPYINHNDGLTELQIVSKPHLASDFMFAVLSSCFKVPDNEAIDSIWVSIEQITHYVNSSYSFKITKNEYHKIGSAMKSLGYKSKRTEKGISYKVFKK